MANSPLPSCQDKASPLALHLMTFLRKPLSEHFEMELLFGPASQLNSQLKEENYGTAYLCINTFI